MFNVGGGELIVILLVALIVLGPDKLPGAVRKVGQVVSEVRAISNGFQAEMRTAMFEQEAQQKLPDAQRQANNPPNDTEPATDDGEQNRTEPEISDGSAPGPPVEDPEPEVNGEAGSQP